MATNKKIKPPCPVFGDCGGCLYQDIPYEDELEIKEDQLRTLLDSIPEIPPDIIQAIVPSPKHYRYRHRLDLRLLKTKKKEVFIGFSSKKRFGVVPVEDCYLALESVSAFIPELKKQAQAKLPEKYRLANLVVKSGEEGRVHWGGIGRRSLRQNQEDYFWTCVAGKKIFYSLETFFQANLTILPVLFERLRSFPFWKQNTVFYDLYGGVGFFSVGLSDLVQQVVLVEENPASVKMAQYNFDYNQITNFQLISGRIEEQDWITMAQSRQNNQVAMIDPPRAGLSPQAKEILKQARFLSALCYLSCQPEALARDLKEFISAGWQIKSVIPFDFFPRTRHLETLAVLKPNPSPDA